MTVVALTGCGDAHPVYESGREIADVIGCAGYDSDAADRRIADGGRCVVGVADIGIYLFESNEARDHWLRTARRLGGLFLVGSPWVVTADDQRVLEHMQPTIGGQLT